MCNRYSQTNPNLEEVLERFDARSSLPELKPRYNISPTQDAPVVVKEESRSLELFRWGLIPSWSKEMKTAYKMMNARAETLLGSRIFKRLLEKKRCLVIADGFYEWKKEGEDKIPMRIFLKSKKPFAFAGLWDRWKSPEEKEIRSFTIVTTGPNDFMAPIHHRMPVILKQDFEAAWLDPSLPVPEAMEMLTPYPDAEMDAYVVSKMVNSPKNDRPEVILPADRDIHYKLERMDTV
jgi:putative SOS response-associated peptidase YedK